MVDKIFGVDFDNDTNPARTWTISAHNGSVLKDVALGDILKLNEPGWIEVTEAWSYASASTITIPTDGTTKYQKGMPVRFKQGGGYKYYNIAAVTATLITVIVNTDYTVANAAITNIAVAFVANPFGFPASFNYTTVITPSAGSITTYSVTSANYVVFGTQVKIDLNFTVSNNGTGSGQLQASLPVTAARLGMGVGREYAIGGKLIQALVDATGTVVKMFNYDGTYPAANSYQFEVSNMYGM